MSEVWLRTNRRAFAIGMIAPAMGLAAAAALALWGEAVGRGWPSWLGLTIAIVSAGVLALLIWQVFRPRIARRGDWVLFYLRPGAPIKTPLEYVEGFLLGQGPSYLRSNQPDATLASTIVIRLADRAVDYAQREVHMALGSWRHHYVTIRGAWCEPLSLDVVNRLNATLAKAQQERPQESRSR